jgi:multidrug efflux system membrane fusion protein
MIKELLWSVARCLWELSSNRASRLLIYGAVTSFVIFDGSRLSAQPAIEGVRSVKVDRVMSASDSQVREFVGEVQPVRYWALGFEVSGRITEVMFREGDEVKKGQVLARLDKTSYRLKLISTEADLRDGERDLVIAKNRYQAQGDLRDRGFTSQRAFEQAQTELNDAEAAVARRRVLRDLAQLSLDSTDLVAPADGIVAKRSADPFVDVTAGQVVMRVDILGEVQIAVRVPANLMQRTERGLLINIRANGQNYRGAVSEVAARVEAGNAFQVIVAVEGANSALRPGMTANVQFRYERQAGAVSKIMIPLRSMLPGSKPMEGYVFVYDVEQNILRKTQVNIIDLNNNYLEVVSGLKEGDLIAVAGVAFLADGQKVSLFNPSILKGAETIKSGPSVSVR